MTGIRSRTGKRSAFTAVELMVVILIIALLVSLLTAGVVKVMGKIPEIQTRTEISQLDASLQAFMTDFGLSDPPPSYLVLYENITLYSPTVNPTVTPIALASYAFLQKAFGKNLGSPINPAIGFAWVDWNGDNTPNGPLPGGVTAPWILEGEQCLVFYTGGIPNTLQIAGGAPPGCLGFSANKMNPAIQGGKRKGPYYTFQSSRLTPLTANTTASSFFVYLDPWKVKNGPAGPTRANGWPYAYFSSNGINNSGYTLNSGLKDCQLIGAAPYYTAPNQFTNSNRYQIISAGQNGTFGNGFWNPSSGPLIPGTLPLQSDPNGVDDQTNFSSGLLGTGQR